MRTSGLAKLRAVVVGVRHLAGRRIHRHKAEVPPRLGLVRLIEFIERHAIKCNKGLWQKFLPRLAERAGGDSAQRDLRRLHKSKEAVEFILQRGTQETHEKENNGWQRQFPVSGKR